MRRLMIAIILVFLASPLGAASKALIEVSDASDEILGRKLVYAVKERIRKSEGMQLAVTGTRFVLLIRTIDPLKNIESLRESTIVFDAIWLLRDENRNTVLYLEDTMGICGAKAVDDIADSIIAHSDNVISRHSR